MLQVLIGIIAIAVIVVIIFYVCQRRAMRVITDLRPGWWPWKKPG